ncbi:MAG: copper resistance protein B [Robiginitomaculum sp.]
MRLFFPIILSLLSVPVFAQTQSETPPEKLWSQADAYFDAAEMEAARKVVLQKNGAQKFSLLMADRLEIQSADSESALLWDGQFWVGGDKHKLWIKSEGEYGFKETEIEEAEITTLYSRAISPYFDMQAGIRYDLAPKGRAHLTIGMLGLAPGWFEVDGAAYLSKDGDLSASFEAEYDMVITQRLILQPRLEMEISGSDIAALGTGSGLTHVDLGARLRYDIKREFAPYIGVEWQSDFGKTADYTRADGGEKSRVVVMAGVKLWR